jgi:ATP-binding cassette, subfamily B, bacterial
VSRWGLNVTADQLSAEERRRVYRRTWRVLAAQRKRVYCASLFVAVQAGATLAGPAIVRYGIDHGVAPKSLATLNRAVVFYLVAIAIQYLFGRLVIIWIARIGEGFLRELRERVFAHLMRLSLEFYDRNRTGSLVARMTADVDSLQELVSQGLSMFIVNMLILTGAVVVMAAMSWQLALGVLIVVPVLVKASNWYRHASNRAYLQLRERVGGTLTSFQEGMAGVRVVQAFNQEDVFRRRFSETNERQYETNLHAERVTAKYTTIIELAQGGAIATILFYGGWLTSKDIVTVGTLAAFVLYLQNLFEPIQQMSQLFNTMQAAGASLQKLYGLLDEDVQIDERARATDLPPTGPLEVDDVSFRYATGPPVLEHVSLTVVPGARLALVGPTGAGKSTLAKLMVRFYDPVAGSVRYGGVDLRDATLHSLRTRIVVVPQEGFLFGGTIRDNVLIARPGATDAEIRAAIDALDLTPRFEAFGDGLDTEVHERGANFSAGERQLISIARAALADPAVVVLDEATSSLDPGTELLVEHALERLMEGRTVIVIAHRLSTAERADLIAVVQGGRLSEFGTHAELVARGGHYASLYRSWSGNRA